MEIAVLLIALGFGYKIFAEASSNNKKQLKQLGRMVGVIIMVAALLGAVCMTICMAQCVYMSQCGICPLHGSKFGPGMSKKFGFKGMCPFSTPGTPTAPAGATDPK
ncbi:MAG: hypothetical protein HY587_04230 [Candidatus Omnitrophica bacterium]|nr:hypothetical protein [Candidatus Omnitrophota bacterium]